MQRVVPVLPVADLARAREFYVTALGFEVDWVWQPEPDEPAFAQISRAGLSLYLAEREATGSATVYLYVGNVDAWHGELTHAGVAIEQAPRSQPWGNREMSLRDRDGNLLTLATVTATPPERSA